MKKRLKRVIGYVLVVAMLAASVSITERKTVKAAYGVGSTVYFGAYFQSWLTGNAEKYAQNLTYDEYDEAKLVDGRWVARFKHYYNDYYMSEPTEWIVLKNEGNVLLLMAKKALTFRDPSVSAAQETDQWSTNNNRAWLNNGFLKYGFNAKERADIVESQVSTYYMSYNDWLSSGSGYICGANEGGTLQTTTDKVFLLDKYEFQELVSSNDRIAYGTQWGNKKVEPVDWYLRGPATWVYGNLVNIYVTSLGNVDENRRVRMSSGKKGIRPVLRVKSNSKYLSTTKPVIKLQEAGTKAITNSMVTLSGSVFNYSGKNITPSVTVRNGNTKLKKGTDYLVSYTNNKWAGVAKVTIKGCSNYKGTVTKTFRIKYNGKKAAAYAKKYVKNNNSKYKEVKQLWDSYDCTNYASQCIHAGGLRMVYPKTIKYDKKHRVKYCKNYWYSIKKGWKYSYSSTWSFASKRKAKGGWGLGEYITNKRNASKKKYKSSRINAITKKSTVGDVLQLTDKGEKYAHHSVIVVSKKYNKKKKRYDIKVAYHGGKAKKPVNFRPKVKKSVEDGGFGIGGKWTVIKMSNAY